MHETPIHGTVSPMNSTRLLLFICSTLFTVPGCFGRRVTIKEDPEPVDAPHGHIKSYSLQEALNARKYYRALGDSELLIKTLQRIIALAPDQQTLESVLYELGELYLTLEKYDLAQKVWGDYVSFFPGADRIAHARHYEFLAHYKDIRAPHHDQTRTKEAVSRGESFLIEFEGETEHDQSVAAAIKDCYEHLFEHELAIADFYLHKYVYTTSKSTLNAAEKRVGKIYKELAPHMTTEQQAALSAFEARLATQIREHAGATFSLPTIPVTEDHAQ